MPSGLEAESLVCNSETRNLLAPEASERTKRVVVHAVVMLARARNQKSLVASIASSRSSDVTHCFLSLP